MFQRSHISVVRSIRQVSLIREWHRARSGADELPNIASFAPNERAGDAVDLSIFRVAADGEQRADGAQRTYVCVHAGERVRTIYDAAMQDRPLHECLDAGMVAAAAPIWTACISTRLPVYSTLAVSDVEGRPVTIEQLFLPYGGKSSEPGFMVVSLHAWSTEGRFIAKGLLRAQGRAPSHQAVVIDPTIAFDSAAPMPAARMDTPGG